ncbi:type II toxin-antitoxin system PrlF family antitoxin [Ruegeria sp. EL01]|uniref:type II toxin-antitoxin system PrlF family antitoxin n=1 Tax=Ruegeria sp. EL01 TaxID=2107578 RepID=UPI000EA7F37D|nr:type II toxin-antitoxin system PrlF family antitoxin [Ruegeria sp. EL01]
MQESTITVKGQTTLPKDVRGALNLSPGDRIRYVLLDGGEVRILRVGSARRLKGLLSGVYPSPVSLEQMEEAIAGGASE